MRFFNTAGPCEPSRNYTIPVEWRLPGARQRIENGDCFVVHAPRPLGKTTALRLLARELTASGKYAALYVTCEAAEVARDIEEAQRGILFEIAHRAELDLPVELRPPPIVPTRVAWTLTDALAVWAKRCPRPLVIFFDEIDTLRGEIRRAVLHQICAGYGDRPARFPWSVVLCGDPDRLGQAASLRMEDFNEREVCILYQQQTDETGQPFTEAALARTFEVTQGQPWLVNALGYEVTHVTRMHIAPPTPITEEHIEQAKERLILTRATHLDSLVARLREPRVRRVMEPLIAGEVVLSDGSYNDDVAYVRDLGLIAPKDPLRVANPIYREVIVRVLGAVVEGNVTADPHSFVRADGTFDFDMLLREFVAFWREHGDVLAGGMPYHEVAPQLVLMAYLQRIVNGGGYVDREYGVGRGRIDLCVRWPHRDAAGKRAWQREAVELKVWTKGRPDPLARGLVQLEAYLDQLGLDRGVLAIFDRRPEAAGIEERTRFEDARTPKGYAVKVLRA